MPYAVLSGPMRVYHCVPPGEATNWNPTKIHHRMIDLKKDQLLQQEWAKNTDPDDKLRWNLDPLNDSSMLDQTDI